MNAENPVNFVGTKFSTISCELCRTALRTFGAMEALGRLGYSWYKPLILVVCMLSQAKRLYQLFRLNYLMLYTSQRDVNPRRRARSCTTGSWLVPIDAFTAHSMRLIDRPG